MMARHAEYGLVQFALDESSTQKGLRLSFAGIAKLVRLWFHAAMGSCMRSFCAQAPVLILWCFLGLTARVATAQTVSSTTGEEPSSSTTNDTTVDCVPRCRSGYLCVKGQCITECNPPCAADEQCKQGTCIAKQQSAALRQAEHTRSDTADSDGDSSETAVAHKGARTHDGFYLRIALGPGVLSGRLKLDGAPSGDDIVGVAGHVEVALGGTPIPGLVVGGGLFASLSDQPVYSYSDNGHDYKFNGGAVTAEVVGPFADFYPSPRGGWHLQAALGVAHLSASQGEPQTVCTIGVGCQSLVVPGTSFGGLGVGALGGVGYEAFVADQWSVGGIARFMYASSEVSPDDKSYPKMKLSAWSMGLLFDVTYH